MANLHNIFWENAALFNNLSRNLVETRVAKLKLSISNKLLPAAELQIQKRKLKQRLTNRLQPQPQNVLCMSPKIFLEFSSFRTRVP